MNMEKIVCNCMDVTVGDIAQAIEDGATTFEEVQEATGADTVCQACEDYAKNVTEELLKEHGED